MQVYEYLTVYTAKFNYSISQPNAEEVHLGLHARADVDLIIYDYEPLEAGVLS